MWNERMRLIRFRRKHERAKFSEELRIIPKWLVWGCIGLYILALIIGLSINVHNFGTHEAIFPDDSLRNQPFLSCLGLAGVITAVAFVCSVLFWTLGYVYRDAKRRGMNPALWTILVLILSGGYFFIGLIIYLLVREPLPFTCPQCAATVSARYNFCPNCKYNLHPACPHCQHEVADTDKFCPYCGAELTQSKSRGMPTATDSQS
jgi:RNA polymerase subunit RPABC4/transcription elongation factor Spt4